MSKLHFGGHALRIARIRLLREWQLRQGSPAVLALRQRIDPTLSGCTLTVPPWGTSCR